MKEERERAGEEQFSDSQRIVRRNMQSHFSSHYRAHSLASRGVSPDEIGELGGAGDLGGRLVSALPFSLLSSPVGCALHIESSGDRAGGPRARSSFDMISSLLWKGDWCLVGTRLTE